MDVLTRSDARWTGWAFGVFYRVNERHDIAEHSAGESPGTVSFADAARFLGVDLFTFHSIVQREEISSILAPNGEFVVSQDDLDKLVKEESSC